MTVGVQVGSLSEDEFWCDDDTTTLFDKLPDSPNMLSIAGSTTMFIPRASSREEEEEEEEDLVCRDTTAGSPGIEAIGPVDSMTTGASRRESVCVCEPIPAWTLPSAFGASSAPAAPGQLLLAAGCCLRRAWVSEGIQ